MEASSETKTKVITLPEGEYGSFGIEAGTQLLDAIADGLMREAGSISLVVVDLKRVRYFGAGLIGWLVDLANRLNRFDVRLQVRGDQLGLLQKVGLGDRFDGSEKADGARLTAVID